MTEPKPASKKEIANYEVVPVMMEMISGLSSIRLYIPRDLRTPDGRNAVGKSLDVVKSKFPDGIPFLDPIEDMKIEDPSFLKLLRVKYLSSNYSYSFSFNNYLLFFLEIGINRRKNEWK